VPNYRDAVITKQFPELADIYGDKVWVTIRNPRIMAVEELRAKGLKTDADGEVIDDEDGEKASHAGYGVMARLVIGWRVFDSSGDIELDDDGHPVKLDMPRLGKATAATVAKLPAEIITWLGEEMGRLNPPKPTPDQEDGTGKK
jgi:hypothetical protein